MKKIFVFLLLLFTTAMVYGQWNSVGVPEEEGDGHNVNPGPGSGKNENTTAIVVKQNGLHVPIANIPNYRFYAIAYYTYTPRKGDPYTVYETVGTASISEISAENIATYVETPHVEISTLAEMIGDGTSGPNGVGDGLGVAYTFYWIDFDCGIEDDLLLEFVVIDTKTGLTASTGPIGHMTQESVVNFIDASAKLSITVPILASLCSGSTTGNTTTATVSGAGGAYTIALEDAGGSSTFLPAYATVSGDDITISSTCPAGSYKVKAKVDDGTNTAETEFTFTVNQTPKVKLSEDKNPVCSGDGVVLTATVEPGGTYTYKWEEKLAMSSSYSTLAGTGATNTLSGLTATKDYRVIAANGSCKDTVDAPVRVEVNSAPSFNITPNSLAVCQGELVSLTATKTDGDNIGVTFAWNESTSSTGPWTSVSGQTTSNLKVTPTTAGDIYYQVVGTLNGCPGKKEQKVTVNVKPNLNVTTQPTAVCDGVQVDLASATLTGSVGTPAYYSDKSCTTSSSSMVTVAAADSPKSYWVVVKNTSGCSDTAELTATVNPLPTKPTITGGTELCEGSSTTISASSGYANYVWKAGATVIAGNAASQSISPTATTSYTVEVADSKGCKNTSDAYSVTVNTKPTVTFTSPTAVENFCAGADISLLTTVASGSGSYTTYTWTGATKGSPETKASATLAAGNNTFKLVVTDSKGCSGEKSIVVVGNSINAGLTASPASITAGGISTLTASYTPAEVNGQYEFWEVSPAKNKIQDYSTTNTKGVTPTETTTYRVFARNAIGCVDSADATVTVAEKPLGVTGATAPSICAGETTVSGVLEFKATVQNGAKPYQSVAWTGLPAWVQVDRTDSAVIKITGYASASVGGTYPIVLTVTDKNGVTESASANFVVNALPTILINGQNSGDIVVCKNTSLTLTATGGTSYKWTAPTETTGATRSVTTTTADATGTNYTVIGTNANGCSTTVTRKVIINELPTISIDAVNTKSIICSEGTATLAATGATTYSWSNGGTALTGATVTTPVLTAGTTYTVTGTDANECKNTATQAVTVNPLPTVSFNTVNDDCAGSEINLSVVISGTAPYKNYTWSSNAAAVLNDSVKATSTLVAGANDYTFSVADANGCVGNASKSVNGLKYTVTLVADPSGTVTEGTAVDLTANVSPSGSFTYTFKQIDPVQTDLPNTGKVCSVTVSETSTYRAYIAEAVNGCIDSGDITISTTPSVLRIESSQTAEICQATEGTISGKELSVVVKGGTRGYTYSWTDIPAGITTTSNNDKLIITGISSTEPAGVKNIKITVTDAGGASVTGTVALTVNAIPDVKINGAKTGVLNACVKEALTLAVTPVSGVTYEWLAPTGIVGSTNTQVINTATVMSSTAYTVKVTDAKGCIAEATRDVVVNSLPIVTLVDNKSSVVCAGTEVTLTPDGADSYTWSHGLSGDKPKVTPTVTTRYKVTGKNNTTGCSDTTSVLITVNPLPTITITQDPTGILCVGSSVELTAGGADTYVWTDGPSTDKYTVSPTATTTYEVTGKDVNGCENTKQHAVNVQEKPVLALNTPAPGCGTMVDLSALINGSGTTSGMTYKYYTGADVELTGSDIRVTIGGTYKVEGFTTEGCSTGKVSVEVVINPNPTVVLDADKSEYCSGDTVRLTATVPNPDEVTYTWNPSVLGTLATATDCPMASNSVRNITYKVTATITATGCSWEDTKTVAVNPLPRLSGSFTPATNPIPEGTSLTLTVTPSIGTPGYSYTWVTPAGSGNAATVTSVTPPSCDFKVFAVDANGCKSDTLKESVTVTPQGGILDATIEAAKTFVCTNGMTVLTAKPVNGKAGYHYSWTKSGESGILGTAQVLNVTTAGKYIVTVTDESSPMQTKTAEITIQSLNDPAPVANAGVDQTIAMGSSTVLFGSATGSSEIKNYIWSPSGMLAADVATANPSTTSLSGLQKYTLYVKDAVGCISKPDEVTIDVSTSNPEIRVVASPATICKGNTSQFSVIAENGTLSAPTYEWMPSTGLDNNQVASPKFTGTTQGTFTYVVKITDGANVYGGKVYVTVQSDGAPKLEFAAPAVNCAGDVLTVNNTGTIVTGTGYTWIIDGVASTGRDNSYTLPIGTHDVTVIAVGTNGCASDSVKTTATINELPVIQFASGNPTSVVEGTAFNMVAEKTTASVVVTKYNWTSPSVITGSSDTYVATAAGSDMTFTLTGESDAGCKSAPITTTVTVTPSGDRLKVTANIESDVVCVGGASYLSATASKGTPGYTYKWFVEGVPGTILSNDSTYTAKPTVSTNYVVQVTDNNLPTANVAYDTVRLTMGANTAPVADAGVDMSVLAGETTVLFGSGSGGAGGYTYVWSPQDKLSAGQTTANPITTSLTSAQIYTLYVVDANGCKSKSDDVQVSVIPDEDFFAIEATASPQSICLGNTSTLGVKVTKGTMTNVSYLWSPSAGLSAINVASPKFTPTGAGTFDYYVTVTNQAGQHTSAKVTITVTSDNAPQIAFDGTPRCVGDTINVKHINGPTPVGYDRFVSFEGNLQETINTLENFYKFAQSGSYNVKFIAHAGGCNSDTISGNYTIGAMLNATVTPEYIVEAKDAVFDFEVTSPVGDYGYEWSGVVYNAGGGVNSGAADPVDASTKNDAKMSSTALKGDVRYIVKVTDNTGGACPTSDTVWAYILPDAPSIDIDTAVSRVTAKISWANVDTWATGSTIMGRKWDPYCMTSADGGVYNPVNSTTNTIGDWAVPTMDTLEFYYMTSYRIIPEISPTERHYAKATSDTVGYYLYDIKMNVGKTSLNVFAMYFDMSKGGTPYKASDILKQEKTTLNYVKYWNYLTQTWVAARFMGTVCIGDFEIKPGILLQFEPKASGNYMQYGKLLGIMNTTLLNTNAGRNLSCSYLWLHRLDLTMADGILSRNSGVSMVKYWNFSTQTWVAARYMGSTCLGNFSLKPLLPLQFELKTGVTSIDWK